MATDDLQTAIEQAQRLSTQEQLQLIKHLAEKLAKAQSPSAPHRLQYGKYRNTPMREFSTEEDFKLAEWHPSEEEMNGS